MTPAPGVAPQHFIDVIEATWPAAGTVPLGPWTLRDGQGGGKRVSAATARAPVRAADLPGAEAAMRRMGQAPLFLVQPQDGELDALLAGEGYEIVDPVNIFAAPIGTLASSPPPPVSTWCIWEPLAIMHDIWEDAGIGAARRAVMARARTPKTAILGRVDTHAPGAGFVGLHEGTAMMHALEVRAAQRRLGVGRHMMRAAAIWAAAQGGQRISAVCIRSNASACALYASLGMEVVGQYHYRRHPEGRNR